MTNTGKKILRTNLVIVMVFMAATNILAQKYPARTAYIEKYKDIAIRQMKETGIPASIILAQACLESGDGKSKLAVKANNHFGIKCHEWKGPSIRIDDDKRNECFRKYRNAEESFKDHSKFLTGRSRYAFLFDYGSTDYTSWAYGLKKAGYATNPKYPQLLIKIIEENELYRYDADSRHKRKKEKNRTEKEKTSGTGLTISLEIPAAVYEVADKTPVTEHHFYRYSEERTIFKNNGKHFIVAVSGDTYKKIAREYHLFKSEILSFNDRKKDCGIKEGEIIYLQKKGRKAAKAYSSHTLGYGESMHSVAQKYGIRLKRLYKMNNIPEGMEPECGTVLKLR